MRKLLIIYAIITIACYSARMDVNFNEGTSTEEFDLNDVEYIQITEAQMVFVEGGTFEMGGESDSLHDGCRPVHSVTVSDYYIGRYEVTQLEWSQYMPLYASTNEGYGDNFPAYYMNWYAIIVYCNKRSIAEEYTPVYSLYGSTDPDDWGTIPTYSNPNPEWDAVECNWVANGYRLPTEAEWEYAARGGSHWIDNYTYSGSDIIDDVAWYFQSANPLEIGSRPIGMKKQNQLGIYDMSGNLAEFCWDWSDFPDYFYYQDCLDSGTVVDPHGPESGDRRKISRGGSWLNDYFYCLLAFRTGELLEYGYGERGFRIVRRP
ncbi:MAG: SUMF1/EgtB/PvdO family nonheme iron enzyme [Candidatus Delongbacteria bacterium]|jgi:sulfatase modifying factor 1|nr:SUMF1/EgtB/PvdO family nonheme iron enzyme [Candidatus Delongbacteria bacterium]